MAGELFCRDDHDGLTKGQGMAQGLVRNFYRFIAFLWLATLLPFYARIGSLLPYPHPMPLGRGVADTVQRFMSFLRAATTVLYETSVHSNATTNLN